MFPRDWSEDGMFAYVDFAYSDSYIRYRLPNDAGLLGALQGYLCGNLEMLAEFGDLYGKVWIRLTEKGHEVDLP